jgi:DNA polymerase-3 subunit delta'
MKQLVLNNDKPCIVVGKKGMGKLTLALECYPSSTVIGDGVEKIKVDQIRQILEQVVNMSSQEYIIRNADNLTVQSQNALLKVLEECPEHVRFLILCEDPSKVLTTIKSRCNLFKMKLYTDDEIEEYVKLNYPNIKKYRMLQNYCKGVLGTVDRIAGKLFVDVRNIATKIIFNLPKTSVGNIFNIIEHVKPIEENLSLLLDTMIVIYTDLHFVKIGAEEFITDIALLDKYKEFDITPEQAYRNVKILDSYKRKMGVPVNFTMFVDTLMLRLRGVI